MKKKMSILEMIYWAHAVGFAGLYLFGVYHVFWQTLLFIEKIGPKKFNDFKDLQNRKIADFGILDMWKCKVDMQ